MGGTNILGGGPKGGMEPQEVEKLKEEIKVEMDKIGNFVDDLNGHKIENKVTLAIQNKLISAQKGHEMLDLIGQESKLFDRYNQGEITEDLLAQFKDYYRRLEAKKDEIFPAAPVNAKLTLVKNNKEEKEIISRSVNKIKSKPEISKKEAMLDNKQGKTISAIEKNSEEKRSEKIEIKITDKRWHEGKEMDEIGKKKEGEQREAGTYSAEDWKEAKKLILEQGEKPVEEKIEKKESAAEKEKTEKQKELELKGRQVELLMKLEDARKGFVKSQARQKKAEQEVYKLSGLRQKLGDVFTHYAAAHKEKGKFLAKEAVVKEAENNAAAAQKSLAEYKASLAAWREFLFDQEEAKIKKDNSKNNLGEEELKKVIEKSRQEFLRFTVIKEAALVAKAKDERQLGEMNATRAWVNEQVGKAMEWYQGLSLKVKIPLSIGLVGAGIVGGILGGTPGSVIFTGLLGMRLVGAMATVGGTEKLMEAMQERGAVKEINNELADKIINGLKGQDEALDKKLFELIGRQEGQKKIRFAVAGLAGTLVASGALGWLFKNFALGASDSEMISGKSGASIIEKAPLSATVEVKPGDSVWKIIENQAQQRGLFKDLAGSPESVAAKKTYIISALQNKLSAAGVLPDIDKIIPGQKIDLALVFGNQTELDKTIVDAVTLPDDKIESILKNNQAIVDWAASHSGEALDTEKVTEILSGGQASVPESAVVSLDMFRLGEFDFYNKNLIKTFGQTSVSDFIHRIYGDGYPEAQWRHLGGGERAMVFGEDLIRADFDKAYQLADKANNIINTLSSVATPEQMALINSMDNNDFWIRINHGHLSSEVLRQDSKKAIDLLLVDQVKK